MAERFTLTTPVITTLQVSDFAVDEFHILRSQQRITVVFIDSVGNRVTWARDGAAAMPLINGLNKANLPVKSLERRCFEFAAADGAFGPGTVTGAPD